MAKTRLTVMVRDDEKSKTKTIAQGDGILIGTTQKLDGEVKVTISTTSLHPLEYLLLARQILDQAMTTCLEYENTLSDDPIRKRFQQMVANILAIDAEAEAAYEDNICVDEDIEPAKIIHFPEKK